MTFLISTPQNYIFFSDSQTIWREKFFHKPCEEKSVPYVVGRVVPQHLVGVVNDFQDFFVNFLI